MAAPTDRERLEGLYTAHRILELRLEPVRGNFDVVHLKEINRRIFQDLPGLGFDDVTPGEYRPAVEQGYDWVKTRRLETIPEPSHVAYSSMDQEVQDRLTQLLKGTNPNELAKLDTAEFIKTIGKLYSELDYIHPFSDGNSRTLREFMRELAEMSGYTLDWDCFSKAASGRDVLYIARDLSVNELALPHIRHDSTKRDVLFSMDQFEGNRDLPELLRDAIRPSRAIAFEQMPETEAIKEYRDLAEAFKTMHAAAQFFETKMPEDVEAQRNALLIVRKHVQMKLDQGETRDFCLSSTSKQNVYSCGDRSQKPDHER